MVQMNMNMSTFGLLVCAWMVCVPCSALAVDFVPFGSVHDVCPTCPKRAVDEITLNNKLTVKAKIVAENTLFYVVHRFGEVRAVPKANVAGVVWANGTRRSGLLSQDQIVLTHGVVFTGSIVEEKSNPGFFRLQSSLNNQTFVIFKVKVRSVFKAGTEYTFKR